MSAAEDFIAGIELKMTEQGVTRSELADRLGCGRSHITQMLAPDRNLTLKTMVKLAKALGLTLDVRLVP